ncbi:MAG: 50S ribosomal protein L11 methyltransferase [Dehalococcoidia bacterium]|nr:50S ribosomal protein L11 methyltransferase [Dehalococcoidia bacterium]
MQWLEFVVEVPAAAVDAFCDLLHPIATGGVACEPAIVTAPGAETYHLGAGLPTLVRAYLPVDDKLAGRRCALAQAMAAIPAVRLRSETLMAGEDWTTAWRRGLRVQRVGAIVVKPSWRRHHPKPQEIVIEIDPGLAFGTGDHATTRACLAAMQRVLRPGDLVLDLGTGTGVLAIAAARLGARAVLAVDTDEFAIDAARSACAHNGVEAIVEQGSLDHPTVRLLAPFDMVLANLTSHLHQSLAGAILQVIRPGGHVVGSGIGVGALRFVTRAYLQAGARAITTRRHGQWRSIVASKE